MLCFICFTPLMLLGGDLQWLLQLFAGCQWLGELGATCWSEASQPYSQLCLLGMASSAAVLLFVCLFPPAPVVTEGLDVVTPASRLNCTPASLVWSLPWCTGPYLCRYEERGRHRRRRMDDEAKLCMG